MTSETDTEHVTGAGDLAPLDRIALARLGIVSRGDDAAASPNAVAAVLAELAHAGIRITNPERAGNDLAGRAPALVAFARRLRGEHGHYAPLFAGFPDQLPTFDDAETRFTIGLLRLAGTYVGTGRVTDDDVRAAMDFSAIGWWPASSVPQDVDRTMVDRQLQRMLPPDERVEWLDVALVAPAELPERLRAWMSDAFAAPAALRTDVREDLATLVELLGADHVVAADVPFIETRTLLTRLLWQQDPSRLATAGLSPDDLLRLFADLTDGDVSLATPVTFPRFTRAQRRAVVAALEASPRLPDVFRRRGLWLAIARGLHLGEGRSAPRTEETFARLRASRHDATSLPSRVERALREERVPDAVRVLAAESPGVLLRGLRRYAALAERAASGTPSAVAELLDAVEREASGVPARVLWAARYQVADNGRTYPRVAFTKTGAALKIDRPAGHLRVSGRLRSELLTRLDAALDARAAAGPSWAGRRVFVDPRLRAVLMPDALRTTAQGVVQLERGSRLALGEAPVLRLFVHWRQAEGSRSDLDLSLQALDADYGLVEHVSWTRLGNGVMTHSGDLTSAPVGAQEFVDVRLDAARAEAGWRYLVPSVFRFAGPSFARLPEAHVGWMLREECSADRRTFDPATVVNAFALTGRAGTAVPMLVDLETNEVVSTDLYLRSELAASVEHGGLEVRDVVAAAATRADLKVNVAEVAARVAAARGAVVCEARAEADLTFGLDDSFTYNALRPERLLAELY
jgi:hypothetical protein